MKREKREPVTIVLGIGTFLMFLVDLGLGIGLTVHNDAQTWWQNARNDREALVSEQLRIESEEFSAAKSLYYDRIERLQSKMKKVISTMQQKLNSADAGMNYYSQRIKVYEEKTKPRYDRAKALKYNITSRLEITKAMGLNYILSGNTN